MVFVLQAVAILILIIFGDAFVEIVGVDNLARLLGDICLPLLWGVPMGITTFRCLRNDEPMSKSLKICTLLFVSLLAGILMLCYNDEDLYYETRYADKTKLTLTVKLKKGSSVYITGTKMQLRKKMYEMLNEERITLQEYELAILRL